MELREYRLEVAEQINKLKSMKTREKSLHKQKSTERIVQVQLQFEQKIESMKKQWKRKTYIL